MFTLNDIQQKFKSTLCLRPAAVDMPTLRTLCACLLEDVPDGQSASMLAKLSTMRRASDLWHVRSALFNVIARYHGEQVAKDRLLALDDKLLPFAGARTPPC